MTKRIERLQEKATAALEVMRSEAAALRGAELYWVARSMVDAAVGAAATLPACYLATVSMRQRLSVP